MLFERGEFLNYKLVFFPVKLIDFFKGIQLNILNYVVQVVFNVGDNVYCLLK